MKLSMNHKENETYKFEPADDDHEQAWNIRILDGMFNETVIQYGAVEANGEGEEAFLSFNFHVISSPDAELTSNDEQLQEEAGDILQEIIRASVEANDGTIGFKEKNAD